MEIKSEEEEEEKACDAFRNVAELAQHRKGAKKSLKDWFPANGVSQRCCRVLLFSEETGFERGELAAVVVEGGGADGENLPFFAAFSLAACDVTG